MNPLTKMFFALLILLIIAGTALSITLIATGHLPEAMRVVEGGAGLFGSLVTLMMIGLAAKYAIDSES